MHRGTGSAKAGFTLIELSIVLVVIGLIVGGVLVGQDLIRASQIRATITQIEKYNTAANTFYGKFAALPGDMNYTSRATYGFNTSGGTTVAGGCAGVSATPGLGQGDGNGIIEGFTSTLYQAGGETGCFWVDLSSNAGGNLIDGGYTTAMLGSMPNSISGNLIQPYQPPAKLGGGNYIFIYTHGGINYYTMSVPSFVIFGTVMSTGGLSPAQAYKIDSKMDDGYPNSGNVFAWFLNGGAIVASTNASPAVAGSCFDSTGVTVPGMNPLVAGQGTYATNINGGAGTGCGLSFKFQ